MHQTVLENELYDPIRMLDATPVLHEMNPTVVLTAKHTVPWGRRHCPETHSSCACARARTHTQVQLQLDVVLIIIMINNKGWHLLPFYLTCTKALRIIICPMLKLRKSPKAKNLPIRQCEI